MYWRGGGGGTNFGGWHRKYVTTDSILVCACVLDLDIWHYFIYFSAFIIEREDVTSPADKKNPQQPCPILSLKNNKNNKQTVIEKRYNRVLSLTTLAGPFMVSSLTSTRGVN